MNSHSREKQEDEMKKKILFALFICGMLVTLFTTVCLPAMAHTRPDNGAECEADEGYYLTVGDGNYNDTQHKIKCNK